eukprot:6186363-Pleurochrysis_carterae.AAC.1
MHGAPIIPHSDIAWPPAPYHYVARVCEMRQPCTQLGAHVVILTSVQLVRVEFSPCRHGCSARHHGESTGVDAVQRLAAGKRVAEHAAHATGRVASPL